MRRPLIAGNWKMNLLNSQVSHYTETLAGQLQAYAPFLEKKVDVLLAMPALFLGSAKNYTDKFGFHLAAQTIHEKQEGAFTGEISVGMLKDLGIVWTLVGHSERRQYFNETDATVAAKARLALEHGVKPIVCIGETKEQRLEGKTQKVLETQLLPVLEALKGQNGFVLAYEPVWAIGTGLTASDEQAQEAHAFIRSVLSRFSDSLAADIRILYGGSVKSSNIKGLMSQSDIDGALVGGASLDPVEFSKIVKFS